MFDMIGQQEKVDERADELIEWPLERRLADEKELLGFYISGHPLDPYQMILDRYCSDDSSTMTKREDRAMTRVGGLIASVQSGISKKSGKPYAMLTIEDRAGSFQVLCTNENHDRYQALFEKNLPILILGEINTSDDKVKLFPQEIVRLEDAPKRWTEQVHIRVQHDLLSEKMLYEIRDLVGRHSGKCPLFLCIQMHDADAVFIQTDDQFSVLPSAKLEEEIASLLGSEAYHIRAERPFRQRDRRARERK